MTTGFHQTGDPQPPTRPPAADTLTAASCRDLAYAISGGCDPCRVNIPANPDRWPARFWRTPLIDLFAEGKLKCRKCKRPFSSLKVDVGFSVLGVREKVAEWIRSD